MRSLLSLIGALALCAFTATASASPADPKNGVEYLTLAEKQNTDSGNKVEVTEFFAYYCGHCHAFEPVLAAWVKKQGDNIVFKRVHVARGPQVAPQQRLFYTLDAMGLLQQYHDKVFTAMHGDERLRLNTDELVFDWAAKAGIERVKFIDTYRSFGITARLNQAQAMMQDYQINGWPMVAVGGHYLTSPYQASTGGPVGATEEQRHQAVVAVLDHLVAKAKADKK